MLEQMNSSLCATCIKCIKKKCLKWDSEITYFVPKSSGLVVLYFRIHGVAMNTKLKHYINKYSWFLRVVELNSVPIARHILQKK